MDAAAVSARLIGSFLVDRSLIDQEQLEEALAEQQATGRLLGEILVERFGVTRADLETALADQRAHSAELRDDDATGAAMRELEAMLAAWEPADLRPYEPPRKPIGQILVEQDFISPGQLDDALEQQRYSGRKLGEILLSSGTISRLRLWNALEAQAASFVTSDPAATTDPLRIEEGLRLAQAGVDLDGLRAEIDAAAERLGVRVDRLEQEAGAEHATLATLRAEIGALVERVESILPASESLRNALASTAAQVDQLVSGSADAEAGLRDIAYRIQANDNVLQTQAEQLSEAVAAAAPREQVDRLRRDLDDLRAAVSTQPSAWEWREPVGALTRRLDELARATESAQSELERLRAHPSQKLEAVQAQLDELCVGIAERESSFESWREAAATLAVRLDEIGDPSHEWRAELAPLLDRLRERVLKIEQEITLQDDVKRELAELRARLDAGSASGEQVERLRSRVEESERDVYARLGELSGAVGSLPGHSERLDAAFTRIDELRSEVSQALDTAQRATGLSDELEARTEQARALAQRVDGLEQNAFARIDELREALASLPDPGKRIDDAFARVDDLRTTVAGLPDPAPALADVHGRIDAAFARVDALRSLLEGLTDPSDALADLGRRIDRRGSDLEELRTTVHALPDPTGRIDAAFARIDELRTTISALPDPTQRLDAAFSQIEDLRAALFSLPDPTPRLDELGTYFDSKMEELFALFHALERRLDDSPDPAALIAPLAERIDATEEGFAAARARFDRLEPMLLHPLFERTPKEDGESTYVAFFPADGGWRVVDCTGRVPSLGGLVELDGLPGMLRVARLGRSPLPLDDRPCAYLDKVSDTF